MCHFQLLFSIIAATIAAAVSASNSTSNSSLFEDCATKFSTLEQALYETGDNQFELNRVFYPPSVRTSRFIRVNYTFLNENGEDDGCSIAYIWAIGILLFFQPPAVFTYNSLYFNYPNNNLTALHLKLPYECRPLIRTTVTESGSMCSCVFDSHKLDILTQQINIYAKFTNPGNIERVNTFARAVCAEELENTFYSGNEKFDFIIVCLTILLPFIFLLIFIIFIRNVHDDAIKSFTHPSKHGILVAMSLCGILVSIGVLVFDILACYVVASGNHEYANDISGTPLNLYIVFGTLVCDSLFTLPLLFCIVYVFAYNGKNYFKVCCKCDITCSASEWLKNSLMAIIIGKNTLEKVTRLSDNDVIALMFSAMLISPLLSFASHIGYIMLAWLTEPSKCTTILILFYILGVYFYLSFRKCYKHYARIYITCNCLERKVKNRGDNHIFENDIPLVTVNGHSEKKQANKTAMTEHVDSKPTEKESSTAITNKPTPKSASDESFVGSELKNERYDCCCLTIDKVEKKHINTQAFCLLFFFSFFFLGIMVMIITIIIVLPLSSEELVTYLFNIFQLTIVIISTQVAYELYFGSSFSLKHVFQKFREVFASKKKRSYNKELVEIAGNHHDYSEIDEATGAFAAELTDVIVQKFCDNNN